MTVEGFKFFQDAEGFSAFDINAFLMSQSVTRFDNSTDRDTALSSVLSEGMVSYDKSTNVLQFYDGTSWIDVITTSTFVAAGSDGEVQYNNGGVFGGASALYYDDVNSRVGIGTTSPQARLGVLGDIDVVGNDRAIVFGRQSETGPFGLEVWNGGALESSLVYRTTPDAWSFENSSGTDILTVDVPNQRVGIGTASPSQKLDVNGDIVMPVGNGIMFDRSGSDSHVLYKETAGSSTYGAGDDVILRNPNGARIRLQTNGTNDRMVITSTGNVGINDTSPSYTLDVNGTGRFTGQLTYARLVGPTDQTRDKIRVWNNGAYTIGMESGYTYGHLNDYAMTFQMNNDSDRGFWWGDDAHSNAQGAMSLTTNGKLTVATSISVGQGESITAPSGTVLYSNGDIYSTNSIYALTNLYVSGDAYIGKNGGGDSNAYFYDDNSNTWRTLQWDDSANDWAVEDNGGTIRVLYHSGNCNNYSVDWYADSVYVDNWFRAKGDTGLYFEDKGTGIRSPISEGGQYGSVATYGNEGGYEGFSIGGRTVFMHDMNVTWGIYNDVNNEWLIYGAHNSGVQLRYNNANRLDVASDRVENYSGFFETPATKFNHTYCGGGNNQIAFRWSNPYLKASIDNVTCATVVNFSDERVKTDIVSWDGGMDIVRQLRPVTYTPRNIIGFGEISGNIIEGPDVRDETLIGLIAQEVGAVCPSAVARPGPDGEGLQSILPDHLFAILISAVKDIDSRLSAMETV